MDGFSLQDRFSRGMGAAARSIGTSYDLYRARGPFEPVAPERAVLRLSAAFDLGDPGYQRPRGYERALRGMFDADSTCVGDYLKGARGVLFVAMLPPLQRPLCVLTNAVFDVERPLGPELAGLNGYGGAGGLRVRTVLAGWPGQLLGGVPGQGALPDDGGRSGWSVLLPPTPEPILGSDLLRDLAGKRFIVRTAEFSELGWRLLVREAEV